MKWLFWLVVVIVLAASVSASYISIQADVTSQVSEQLLGLQVNVTNRGDESAHNVQVMALAGEQQKHSQVFDLVGVNEQITADFRFNISQQSKGKYPVMVRVDYADANLYPFSALTSSSYYIQENVNSEVFASMQPVELSGTGKVEVLLRNMADNQKNLSVRLVAPKELKVDQPEKRIVVPGKEEKQAQFKVDQFSALQGSSYVVYSVVEYQEQGVHYTTFGSAMVNIVEKEGLFNLSYYVLVPVVAGLVILFIILQFKKKK